MSNDAPLAPGQTLYHVQETTLIKEGQYQRVTFTGLANNPQASLHDGIDLSGWGVRSARTVTDDAGIQCVAVLTKTGLSLIDMPDQTSRLTKVVGKFPDDVVRVIGFDPGPGPLKGSLALLVTAGAGFAVVHVDPRRSVRYSYPRLRSDPAHLPLPAQVKGPAFAAELVRHGSSWTLMLVTMDPASDPASLLVHAVPWEDIGDVEPKRVKTLTLGSVVTEPGAVTVPRMRAKSPDQQLAVAWAADRAHDQLVCKVALVGWGSDGEATVLATPEPNRFESKYPYFRLAAADLLHNGSEQLVLGYRGPDGYSGSPNPCTALMLFTLDESNPGAPKLKCESKYKVAGSHLPWELEAGDLHLGAGLFGTCMGVQLITISMEEPQYREPARKHVECCFVPVQAGGFPPMDGDNPVGVPSCVLGEAPARASSQFLAFPSDLSGQSVVLGPPKLIQRPGCTQLLALIQAPPFDQRFVSGTKPSVSYTAGHGEASGLSVTKDNSSMLSEDTGVNLGLGPLQLSAAEHNSYLESLAKTQDESSTTNVTFHSTITDYDYLLTYAIDYNIWSYPAVRGSLPDKAGELLVVFPQEARPTLKWLPAHTYGYRPRSEVGMLLSYINVEKPGAPLRPDGYKAENLLFETDSIAVTAGQDTSTISFDKSSSKMNSDSKHISVLNSTSEHAGFTASTDYFAWFPMSFGLNIGSSHSYSDSDVKTTHLTVHDSLSLSVTSGSIKDELYVYEMTPYIYHHEKLGCLVLAWGVEAIGQAFKPQSKGGHPDVTAPDIRLIRPVPESKDLVYQQFSRSISFVENNDQTVDIVVEIFNNSYGVVQNVSCDFFLGRPKKSGDKLTLPENHLGKETLDLINVLERKRVTLCRQKLAKPIFVTVQLSIGVITTPSKDIYWNVHPPEELFTRRAWNKSLPVAFYR